MTSSGAKYLNYPGKLDNVGVLTRSLTTSNEL